MITEEPALIATNEQMSAYKEPVTIQVPNMQRFPPTMWQRSRTQASFQSAAIKITCEEVTDYSNEDEDAFAIVLSEVEEQFNLV